MDHFFPLYLKFRFWVDVVGFGLAAIFWFAAITWILVAWHKEKSKKGKGAT